jgi:hypothetical protein
MMGRFPVNLPSKTAQTSSHDITKLISFLAALTLLGCSDSADTEPVVTQAAKEKTTATHWELVGTVGPKKSRLPAPPPFEGGRTLIERCKERRPCGAERWRSESGQIMDMVLIERTFYFSDERPTWPAQWVTINGVLRACLGNPLSIPPTDDPQGVRSLMINGDTHEWWLHFSGNNSCGLEGVLRLNAAGPEIDVNALRCEGKRWREGGRECAKEHLKAVRTK